MAMPYDYCVVKIDIDSKKYEKVSDRMYLVQEERWKNQGKYHIKYKVW